MSDTAGLRAIAMEAKKFRHVSVSDLYFYLTHNRSDAILLSNLVHWGQTHCAEARQGWFYKSPTHLEADCGLTRGEAQGATGRLKKRDFIETKPGVVRGKKTTWYRVNAEVINQAIQAWRTIPAPERPAAPTATDIAEILQSPAEAEDAAAEPTAPIAEILQPIAEILQSLPPDLDVQIFTEEKQALALAATEEEKTPHDQDKETTHAASDHSRPLTHLSPAVLAGTGAAPRRDGGDDSPDTRLASVDDESPHGSPDPPPSVGRGLPVSVPRSRALGTGGGEPGSDRSALRAGTSAVHAGTRPATAGRRTAREGQDAARDAPSDAPGGRPRPPTRPQTATRRPPPEPPLVRPVLHHSLADLEAAAHEHQGDEALYTAFHAAPEVQQRLIWAEAQARLRQWERPRWWTPSLTAIKVEVLRLLHERGGLAYVAQFP